MILILLLVKELLQIEIMNDIEEPIDFVFQVSVEAASLSGLCTYIKNVSPHTHMIGVEPAGAASMKAAFENKGVHRIWNNR